MSDNLPTGVGALAGTGGNWGTPVAVADLLTAGETELGFNFYDITVVRVRGFLTVQWSVPTASPRFAVAAGIGFFPDTLSGGSDYPNPGTDNYDWLWHSFGWTSQQAAVSQTDVPVVTNPFIRLDIDNKSMRKQNENSQNLTLVVSTTSDTAGTPSVNYALRTLIKLP